MIYFFGTIIFFMLVDLLVADKKKKNKAFKILMIIITFFACFRSYEVGTDTKMFWSDYGTIINTPFGDLKTLRYETGYILLCKLLGFISKDGQMLIIISSLFINYAVYRFIINNAKNPLSCGIFYFTLNYYFGFLCLMRQGIAIAILLFAYNQLKKNNNIKFIILTILAAMFHLSAFCMILMPFLKKFKSNRGIITIVIIFSCVAFIFGKQIFFLVANLIGEYSKYLTSQFNSESYISAGLYSITSFLFLLFGVIVPSKESISEESQKDKNYFMLSWILAIGTIISVLSMRVSIFNRLYFYFGFFAILWLANSLEMLQNIKNRKNWKIVLYISTFCYVLVITQLDWYGIFPYSFCWE